MFRIIPLQLKRVFKNQKLIFCPRHSAWVVHDLRALKHSVPSPGVFALGGIVETLWAHNCLFQNVWIFPYIHVKVLKGC